MKYFDFAAAAISDVDSSSMDMQAAPTETKALNEGELDNPLTLETMTSQQILEAYKGLLPPNGSTFHESFHPNMAFPEQTAADALMDFSQEVYPCWPDNESFTGTQESVAGYLQPTELEAYSPQEPFGRIYQPDLSSGLSFEVGDAYLNCFNSRSS
jgi:hypothetical protein